MKKLLTLFILLFCFYFQSARSQVDTIQSPYDATDTQNVNVRLFDSDKLIDIALRFDITTYRKQRSDEEYLPAVLTYYFGEKDSVNKNIKLRARGVQRRAYCDFPPIKLNFKLKDSVSTEFDGIDKLKLVTYCKVGLEDYVLREYLVYKLYNILTDNSFRVRLLRVNYINTAKDKKPIVQYGFVIEPNELLEKRTNSVEIRTTVSQVNISPPSLTECALFNYMIGNTDWSVPNRHNVLLLNIPKRADNYVDLIIPFDFDYSGFVNADYAVPFETLPIKTVRDRLYVSICRSEEEFSNELKKFAEKKDDFYRVINDFPYLKDRSKKDIINYLDYFFSGMDKRNTLIRNLMSDCAWFEQHAGLTGR
jgi:hypothetical protein